MASTSLRILHLAVPVLLSIVVCVQGNLKCDNGWTLYYGGETCLKLFRTPTKSWADARKECHKYGGDLVRIDDNAKQQFFNEIFKSARITVWLGAKRTVKKAKTFRWLDDPNLITHSNWNRGEPNNWGNREDCAATWGSNPKWNDAGCGSRYSYYCEKPAIHSAPKICPPGWKMYGSNCFRLYEPLKTWFNARSWCQSVQGDLATIPDSGTTTFIKNNFLTWKIDTWIGLTDRVKAGVYNWAIKNEKLGAYKNWAPGMPDNKKTRCVHLWKASAHRWDDSNCTSTYSALCQKAALNEDLLCPYGFDLYYKGKTCIRMYPYKQSWSVARKHCQNQRADMVKITDDAMNNYIQKRIGSRPAKYWIGMHKKAKSDKITWLDEVTKVKYNMADINSWRSDTEYCGLVKGHSTSWGKDNCGSTLQYTMCERKAYASVACAAGYTVYKNVRGCFKMSQDTQPWETARTTCQKDGGDLAYITNYWVNKYITDMAKAESQDLWIGLHDRIQNDKYQWLDRKDDLTLSRIYKNWGTDQPKDPDSKLNCVQLKASDGTWYVDNCATKKKYVCQGKAVVHGYTPPVKSSILSCPEGWSKMGADPGGPYSCIKYHSEPLATWNGARDICRKTGGDLIKIDDNDKASYVNALLLEVKAEQIGVEPYIGLNDLTKSGQYVWLDESTTTTFTNWHTKTEPSGGAEHCAVIVVDSSYEQEWNDVTCNSRKGYICEQPAVVPGSLYCGEGWEDSPSSDNCYRINKDTLNWHEARTSCLVNGGDLLSVVTAEEMLYLTGRMSSIEGDSFWAGGNDLSTGSGWKWTDNKPFAFFNWADGEPSTNHSNNCLSVDKDSGRWTATTCVNHKPSICKKLAMVINYPTPTPEVPPTNLPKDKVYACPPKWRSFRNSCYMGYVNGGGQTWAQANQHCHSVFANLVTISDMQENDHIFSLVPRGFEQVWIGLNDFKKRLSFTWADNLTPMTFTNWMPDNPRIGGMEKVCVGMMESTGKWGDGDCGDQKKYFVCEKKKTIRDRADWDQFKGCKQGGKGYYNKCFRAYHSDKSTFDIAQAQCVKLGGNLATVNDRYTEAFISSELLLKTMYWIGLSNRVMTLDDYKKEQYLYTWSSGEKFRFAHWDREQSGQYTNSCVAINNTRNGGMWHSYHCESLIPYVCEYPRPGYSTPQPITTTTPNLPCPKGWTKNDLMCYKTVMDRKLSWMSANAYCQSLVTSGGSLASFTSADVERKIRKDVGAYGKKLWIGLSNRDETGFKWVGGEPLAYTNWAYGEPNSHQNVEDCAEWITSYSSGQWNDINCYSALNFVCQAPRGTHLLTTLTPPTVGPTSTQCGKGGWTAYNGFCYLLTNKVGTRGVKSWFDARDSCNKQGAYLVSITDAKENGYLTTLLGQKKNAVNEAWIGLNDFDDYVYKWVDGTRLTYLNWGANEPNNEVGGERCGTITKIGRWNDLRCTKPDMNYICKKRPGDYKAITRPSPTPAVGGCPVKFNAMPGTSRCFTIVGGGAEKDRKNFMGAVKGCATLATNSRLASIHSTIDQEYLTTLIADLQTPVYIGFNDRFTPSWRDEKNFHWVDNSDVDYVKWGKEKPNSYWDKCVEMTINPKNAGDWAIKSCYDYLPYICEYNKDPMFPTNAPDTTNCPENYYKYRESCYRFEPKLQNWTAAQQTCKTEGGNLVNIRSGFDKAFVDLVLQTSKHDQLWIGLADNSGKNAFTWSDGWPVLYTSWDKGQPDLSKKCVTHKQDSKWATVECELQIPSVCQVKIAEASFVTPKTPGKCPSNIWTQYGDHCYYVETQKPRSWPEASYQCSMIQGQLASVHSQEDAKIINTFIQLERVDAWIGFHRTTKTASFTWSDKSQVEYFNWAAGAPSDGLSGSGSSDSGTGGSGSSDSGLGGSGSSDSDSDSSTQNCALAQGADGKWVDTSCYEKHGYICKVRQVPISTTAATTTTPTTITTVKRTTPKPKVTKGIPTSPTTAKDLCNPNPCYKGKCTMYGSDYLCRCDKGWTGITCNRVVTTSKPSATATPKQGPNQSPATHFPTNPGKSKQKSSDTSDGMKSSEVAGIVVGVLALVAIVVIVAFLFKRRQSSPNPSAPSLGFDNAAYDTAKGGIEFQPSETSSA